MHSSGAIRPITLIWVLLKDLFLPQQLSIVDANFGQKLVMSDVEELGQGSSQARIQDFEMGGEFL